MASRPLASWPAQALAAPAAPRVHPVEPRPRFSDLEWSIVAMAERDGLASLRRPNRFWSLINTIFGIRPANRLASERLEALRRVAVLVWQRRTVPESELQAFFDTGFAPSHLEQLQRRVAAFRIRLVGEAQ